MRRAISGLFLSLSVTLTATAQTSIWNGGNGNWNNPGFWTGGVPGVTSTVLIDTGNPSNSIVTLNVNATIRNLTIDVGDSLQQNDSLSFFVGNGGTGASVLINGTLSVNSAGNGTDLRFANGTGLGGSGTLVLSGVNSRLYGFNPTDQLNIAGLHLSGQGQFGAGALSVASSGTLDVTNGATLLMNPTLFTNTGILQASLNSTPLLSGGRFDNTGGTIQTLDTSVFRLGGSVDLVGGTLNGNLSVIDSNTAYLEGAIQNQGTIQVASAGNSTVLRAVDGMTLDGGGTISLSGTNSQILGQNGSSKWINVNQTYQGNGQVLLGSMDFRNQGTMTIASGTNLRLTGGNLTNTGGTIQISAGATADLYGAVLVGGTVNGPGVVRVLDSQTGYLSGAITNNTDILVASNGNGTDLRIVNGTSLTGSGRVILSGANSRLLGVNATDLLNLPSGLELQGQGQFGANGMKVSNGGTFDVGNGSTLTVDPTLFTNTGTLQASGNSTPLLYGGRFDNTAGTIQTVDTSVFRLGGSVDLVGGTLKGNFSVIDSNVAYLEGAIQNQGTIHVSSNGNGTDLRAVDGMALDGGGTINLSGPNSHILGQTATSKWININQTYQGTGQVLLGSMDFRNQGTLTIASGTNLNLDNGNLTNTGGTIQISAGGTADLHNAVLVGGTVNGPGVVRVLDSQTGYLSAAITSNTDILVASNGNGTDLRIVNGTSLTGSGRVILSGTNSRLLGVNAADLLNLPSGLELQGQGQFGANGMKVSNSGTFDVGNGSTLTLDPTLFTNTGTLQASGNSTPLLYIGRFDNTAGTIQTLDTSVFRLGGSVDLVGGTLKGNFSVIDSNTAYLEGAIQNQGTIQVSSNGNGTDLRAVDGMTLDGGGMIDLHGTNARIYGQTATSKWININQTYQGTGQVLLGNMDFRNQGIMTIASGTNLNLDSGSLTNTGGTIQISAGATADLHNAVLVGGTVNGPGTVRVLDGQTGYLSGAITNNTDILVASAGNGTDLRVVNGTTLNGSGRVVLSGINSLMFGVNATDLLFNNLTITGNGQLGFGSMGVVNDGVIESSGGTMTVTPNGSGLTNDGTLRAVLGSTLTVTGGLNNLSGNTLTDGTYDVIGTLRVGGANITTDSATIILDGPSSQFLNNTTSSNALAALASVTSSGELDVIDGRSFSTSAAFTNAGAVEVGAGSSFANSGDYTQTGGTTNVNGTLDPSGKVNLTGGLFEGNGTVLADLLQSGGIVAPGNSIGVLTIQGDYTMSPAADLDMELGDHAWDRLQVGGAASLGGTLNLLFLPDFAAANGDILTVIDYASHTGTFTTINGLSFGSYIFTPVYNATDFELQVAVQASAAPEPGTWATACAALLLVCAGARRKRL